MLHKVQVTDTSQIAAKKRLLKDINKKKRLAWAKKHKQWTLDRWKSVLWSDESKFEIFGSNRCAFVRCRVGERCDGAWLVTLSVIYLEFKAHFTSMAATAFCSNTPSHLVLRLVGLSFVFQQDNDPTHLQAV